MTGEEPLQVTVSDAVEAPAWDTFLAEVPGGHHVQTSLWAQVKAESGWRPVRVVATRGGTIVGGAQLLVRPLAFSRCVAYVAKGPVVFATEPNRVPRR